MYGLVFIASSFWKTQIFSLFVVSFKYFAFFLLQETEKRIEKSHINSFIGEFLLLGWLFLEAYEEVAWSGRSDNLNNLTLVT